MLCCGGLSASKVLTSTVPSLHYSLIGLHAYLRDEYCSDCGVVALMNQYGWVQSIAVNVSCLPRRHIPQSPASSTLSSRHL